MLFSGTKNKRFMKSGFVKNNGFTLIEVLVAASLMIILCVGTLSVFSYVVKINRGENVRLQALSVLQQKVEFYRSLRFSPTGTSADLTARTEQNVGTLTSADGRVFNILVSIDDNPSTEAIDTEVAPKFKQIKITAVPAIAETGYLSNLRTTVTIQRVRTN
jgi:prepilin-type N-terminal cleavage/methylation domain-containing protein